MQWLAGNSVKCIAPRLRGPSACIADINIRYRDVAEWQRGLTTRDWEPLWNYWKRQLSGDRVNLELPWICARHPIHIYKSGTFKFTLPSTLQKQFAIWFCRKSRLRRSRCAPRLFLHLLHLYSGQQDFLLGITDPCRESRR